MPELKPCPFCGGEATVLPVAMPKSIRHQPSCDEENGCGLTLRHYSTEADAIAAWNTRTEDYRDVLCFIGKWVERGLFCKTTSPQDALSVIAHFPGMPWNSERWDVDHKPYAEAFYKMFPKTREAGDGDL